MRIKFFVFLITVLMFSGCSTVDKGKEFVKENNPVKENPLKKANKKEALTEARANVKKSKREYQNCLDRNSGDELSCEREKEVYEHDTDIYIEIQRQ